MPIIEGDDVVEQFPPQRTEEAFNERNLPRTMIGGADFLDPASFQKRCDAFSVEAVVVSEDHQGMIPDTEPVRYRPH